MADQGYENWRDYFLDLAIQSAKETQALRDYAAQNGISLTEEEIAAVDDEIAYLETQADKMGFNGLNKLLDENYGSGSNKDTYRAYKLDRALADKALTAYKASLSYSDEELLALYAELPYDDPNDYCTVSMRHILILAEADENGKYTEAAISAAHDRAAAIYDEWLSGEASEESFAALAEKHSEDPGSSSNGGLYTMNVIAGGMIYAVPFELQRGTAPLPTEYGWMDGGF